MKHVRVLLVEDNLAEARNFTVLLKRSSEREFEIVHTQYLNTAFQAADTSDFDIVLLDLSLPDSPVGIHTLVEFISRVPDVPVVVLTGTDSIDLAQQSVSIGAQEYLVKSEIRGHVLERSIVQCIQRKKNELVSRQLTYASLKGTVEREDTEDPRITMVRPHIRTLTGYLRDLNAYLRDNAPSHYDAIKMLEGEAGLSTVIKDLNGILNIEAPRRRRRISDQARSILSDHLESSALPVRPPDIPAAKADVLSVLEKYGGAHRG